MAWAGSVCPGQGSLGLGSGQGRRHTKHTMPVWQVSHHCLGFPPPSQESPLPGRSGWGWEVLPVGLFLPPRLKFGKALGWANASVWGPITNEPMSQPGQCSHAQCLHLGNGSIPIGWVWQSGNFCSITHPIHSLQFGNNSPPPKNNGGSRTMGRMNK